MLAAGEELYTNYRILQQAGNAVNENTKVTQFHASCAHLKNAEMHKALFQNAFPGTPSDSTENDPTRASLEKLIDFLGDIIDDLPPANPYGTVHAVTAVHDQSAKILELEKQIKKLQAGSNSKAPAGAAAGAPAATSAKSKTPSHDAPPKWNPATNKYDILPAKKCDYHKMNHTHVSDECWVIHGKPTVPKA